MDCNEYIEKFKEIQSALLDFIENDENVDDCLHNLLILFKEKKIQDDKHDLMTLFHLITKIANNHYRGPLFFEKIDKILLIFQDDFKKKFSNSEIFNIFKSNKRILLFLIEQKLIIIDDYIIKKIIEQKYVKKYYPQYFLPEIKPFVNKKWFPKNLLTDEMEEKLSENFSEKRKAGENDDYICKLIQNDSVEEFIAYVNKNNYSLKSKINSSIFETHSFLIKNENPSLIEYAAFYGAFQIFQYLQFSNVEMKSSLWIYAIHGNNNELIHLLERSGILPDENLSRKCFIEAIKCHHNDIANYIQNNFLQIQKENSNETAFYGLKYYNLEFFSNDSISENLFCYFCKYDYYLFAEYIIRDTFINLNEIKFKMFNKISKHIFEYNFKTYI